jgi:hypothetical protein
MWAPIVKTTTRGNVWRWDEKTLTQVPLQLGVSDGSFVELISGDIKVGDEVVIGVVLPPSFRPTTTTTNPLMGPQNQRGGQRPGGGGGRGGGRGGN